jgi:nitroreductase
MRVTRDTVTDIRRVMKERHSARVPFDPKRPVEREALLEILEAARWAPTAHNMQNFEVVVVDDPDLLDALGKIERPLSEAFIEENYQQLSFSEEELREKGTGVLASMFPPALRVPRAERLKLAGEIPHSFLGSSLQGSPLLLVVLYDSTKRAPASEGDVLGFMSLGCVMENIWLAAHALGLGFQILSVLGADPVEREVKRLLRIPEKLKVGFACRVGYPLGQAPTYLRVRRDVTRFAHHNHFGDELRR